MSMSFHQSFLNVFYSCMSKSLGAQLIYSAPFYPEVFTPLHNSTSRYLLRPTILHRSTNLLRGIYSASLFCSAVSTALHYYTPQYLLRSILILHGTYSAPLLYSTPIFYSAPLLYSEDLQHSIILLHGKCMNATKHNTTFLLNVLMETTRVSKHII